MLFPSGVDEETTLKCHGLLMYLVNAYTYIQEFVLYNNVCHPRQVLKFCVPLMCAHVVQLVTFPPHPFLTTGIYHLYAETFEQSG